MDWTSILSVLLSVSVFEFVKWLMNRKGNSRIVNANADKEEIKAETDEYHLLRERLEVADTHLLEKEKQLYEKEQRFHEQTQLVRELNRQLLEATAANGKLQARISELEAERKMKLCERKGCKDREPQSGY